MQKIIEACYKGDIFKCPCCKQLKEYYSSGMCTRCYEVNLYHTNKRWRQKHLERMKPVHRKHYLADKIGNMDNIEQLCLRHGFSKDVAEAIAMDGIILDKKMKERGIIKVK